MYNYNFLNNDWYRNNGNNPYQQNVSLFNPTEGYNRGILFSDLYSQYKNYKPATLTANNDRGRMLLDLGRLSFAAHDLNLYLDLNPSDESMLALFNDYRQQADQIKREYEAKYGPLDVSSNQLDQTPFQWAQGNWPWEGGF